MENERQLINRLLARDESAYEQAVRDYQAGLLRYARSLVGEAAADEIVQETWVAVLTGLRRFEGRSSLKTWMFSILGNLAKSRLRSESWNVSLADECGHDTSSPLGARFHTNGRWSMPPIPWHEETPDALLASEDLLDCLEKILAKLPPAQRMILTLRDMDGLAMQDICNVLDVSETNGRVLLHRARTSLRAAVERHEQGEEC